MATPANNIFQQVKTYQQYSTALLNNMFAIINKANKQFKDFQNKTANLGASVSFERPYRYVANEGLVMTPQATQQNILTLTCDTSYNVARVYDDEQLLFNNAERYIEITGQSAIHELGSKVESDIAHTFVTNTYRFYGDGTLSYNPLTSYSNLADALELFDEYGSSAPVKQAFVPNRGIQKIISSGLNQFVIDRNEEGARKWMLGNFEYCDFFKSNLLHKHIAGTIGQSRGTSGEINLTVVSTVKNSDGYITAINFSSTDISDANAIKAGDLFQFMDGVTGHENIRFLTFVGHNLCSHPVQFAAAANAVSDGTGNITVQLTPDSYLIPVAGNANQNIPFDITAGMKCWVANSHVAGCINSGNSLYLAMPKLPLTDPYTSHAEMDTESGASTRLYYGTVIGSGYAPTKYLVHDLFFGYTMDAWNSMRLCFPIQ